MSASLPMIDTRVECADIEHPRWQAVALVEFDDDASSTLTVRGPRRWTRRGATRDLAVAVDTAERMLTLLVLRGWADR